MGTLLLLQQLIQNTLYLGIKVTKNTNCLCLQGDLIIFMFFAILRKVIFESCHCQACFIFLSSPLSSVFYITYPSIISNLFIIIFVEP